MSLRWINHIPNVKVIANFTKNLLMRTPEELAQEHSTDAPDAL
jgi:hypothetical protein